MIVSKLAPPVRGKGAIRTTFQHVGGEVRVLVRGPISLRGGPYWLEQLREAFPGCCEACVGATCTERCDQWKDKKTGWGILSSASHPRLREADGVLCRHCIVGIVREETDRLIARAENLGCKVTMKITFPKHGTIENYIEKYGSKARKQEKGSPK